MEIGPWFSSCFPSAYTLQQQTRAGENRNCILLVVFRTQHCNEHNQEWASVVLKKYGSQGKTAQNPTESIKSH